VGDPNAPITVVEFSDFGCRFCRQFATETYPALYREFVMSGKVRWKYVPYVLGIFPNGELAARAGECAAEQGEKAFWAMHDVLFERQREWQQGEARSTFGRFAQELGLDEKRFQGCYDKDLRGERIRGNNELGRQLGVRGTPAFFINGARVEGAIPLEMFRMGLEQMLAETGVAR
jgi:protein-disulfide isomerase